MDTLDQIARRCLPEAVFNQYVDAVGKGRGTGELSEEYSKAHHAFDAAINTFVKEAADAGAFKHNPLADALDAPIGRYWNYLSKHPIDKESYHYKHAVNNITERIFFTITTRMSFQKAMQDPLTYEDIATALATGTLGEDYPQGEVCQETGQRIYAFIKDWATSLFTRKGSDFIPVANPDSDQVYHETVTFPSGRLLIADMVRAQPLMDLLESVKRSDYESIKGLVEMTSNAAKAGFVHVYSGNTCPTVYHGQNGLIVGGHDENVDDLGEFADTGKSVCTDLWWTTIIDEDRLFEIMLSTMTMDEAKAELASVIEDSNGTLIRQVIEPGTYNLYFHGDHERIHEAFKTEDLNIGAIEPQFFLTRKTLTFTPREPEAKKGRKP